MAITSIPERATTAQSGETRFYASMRIFSTCAVFAFRRQLTATICIWSLKSALSPPNYFFATTGCFAIHHPLTRFGVGHSGRSGIVHEKTIGTIAGNRLLRNGSSITTTTALTTRTITQRKSHSFPEACSKTFAVDRSIENCSNADEQETMDGDIQAYTSYVAAAVDLSSAHVSSGGILTVVRTVRDIDLNRKRRFLYTLPLPPTVHETAAMISSGNQSTSSTTTGMTPTVTTPSFATVPVELSTYVQWQSFSPSGNKMMMLYQESTGNGNGSNSDGPYRKFLELWTRPGSGHPFTMQRRIHLVGEDQEELHGRVITDTGYFTGEPAWNRDESVVVYAAEQIVPTTSSYFVQGTRKRTGLDGSQRPHPKRIRGAKYTLGWGKAETWGEKYQDQQPLLELFCVNLNTGLIAKIENVPRGKLRLPKQPAPAGTISTSSDDSFDDTLPIKTNMDGFCLGQPTFTPDGKAVVYTAWDAGGGHEMPRRLGMIYCQQRPSKICLSPISKLLQQLAGVSTSSTDATNESGSKQSTDEMKSVGDSDDDRDGKYVVLTPDFRISKSPQFSSSHRKEDGSCTLVYLSTNNKDGFDTHAGCLALHAMDWRHGKIYERSHRIVVPQVGDPRSNTGLTEEVNGLPFPGLFLDCLPSSCFVSSDVLVTNTLWGSCSKIVRISLTNSTVSLVPCGDTPLHGNDLLCLTSSGGAIVASQASNAPPILRFITASALLHGGTQMRPIQSHIVCQMPSITSSMFGVVSSVPKLDFTMDVTVIPAPSIENAKSDLPIQSVLLLPNKDLHPRPPLIVIPHGGPHSASTTNYLPSAAFLCGHGGYAVLFVNYRGSTGFGQSSIDSLPSRIGEMDVKDVVEATIKIQESGMVDPMRIGVCGGSHGGFLVAHLTSQYPDMFQAACMRNPVVNVATMVSATDIPDWCFVEALGYYNWKEYRPPTAEELAVMYSKSPIGLVSQVKTPTLIALGMRDLRVPPSQGLEWYHCLRSRDVPAQMLQYDDSDHAIAGVASEADHWVHIKRWFDRYLKKRCLDSPVIEDSPVE